MTSGGDNDAHDDRNRDQQRAREIDEDQVGGKSESAEREQSGGQEFLRPKEKQIGHASAMAQSAKTWLWSMWFLTTTPGSMYHLNVSVGTKPVTHDASIKSVEETRNAIRIQAPRAVRSKMIKQQRQDQQFGGWTDGMEPRIP